MNNNTGFANREVCDLIFTNYKTQAPILFVDNANTVTYEMTGETKYAYGGAGHVKLIAFNGEKSGTVKFELQMQTMQLYSFMTGASIETAAEYIKRVEVTCTTAGKLNVSTNPVVGSITIFTDDDDCGTPLAVTVASAAATSPATGYDLTCTGASTPTSGTKYIVYYRETLTNAKRINIKSNTFPAMMSAYAYATDIAEDGTVLLYKMHVYKCVPQNDFSLSFSNANDPATVTVTCDLLADKNKNMVEYILVEQ